MESQKLLYVVIFKLIDTGLAFVFFYFMVIFYEPNVIGKVRFAISFVSIFSFIYNLRFNIAHLKIYPESEEKAACIGTLMFYKAFFISIALIFYFVLLSFLNFSPIVLVLLIIFMFEQIIQGVNNGYEF